MEGDVIPFPLARRRDYVRRQADWLAQQSEVAAERNLSRQLAQQRETLLRRGVDHASADAEVAALEKAIRAEIWSLAHIRGGAA